MRVEFTTTDNVKIVGEFSQPQGATKAILLLHMMPATKESWAAFAEKLNRAGWVTLAIDERGHGQSQGGPNGYQEMSDQRSKLLDVEAAAAIFKSKNHNLTAIAGASIGANLSLVYQAEHPEIVSTIPMSPGLNYREVKTLSAVKKLGKNQRVYFVSSAQDERVPGALQMAQQLYSACTAGDKQIFISNSPKHGTDIFAVEPGLDNKLIEWLK